MKKSLIMRRDNFIGKRSRFSEPSAIIRISKYGIARVLAINQEEIIQEFVEFEKKDLTLNQLASLARKIHSEKDSKGTLVHGDLSKGNTTIYGGEEKCYDYEHAHFGEPYADLGRIILRSCNGASQVSDFFTVYSGRTPGIEEIREGLIYFCNWQYKLRKDKGLSFSEVPLERRKRVIRAGKDFSKIITAFRARVVL